MLITLSALPAVMIVLLARSGVLEAMSRIVQNVMLISVWTGAIMNIVLMDVLAAFATPLPQDAIGTVVALLLIRITGRMILAVALGAGLNVLEEGVAVTQTHGAAGTQVLLQQQTALAVKEEQIGVVVHLLLPLTVQVVVILLAPYVLAVTAI